MTLRWVLVKLLVKFAYVLWNCAVSVANQGPICAYLALWCIAVDVFVIFAVCVGHRNLILGFPAKLVPDLTGGCDGTLHSGSFDGLKAACLSQKDTEQCLSQPISQI